MALSTAPMLPQTLPQTAMAPPPSPRFNSPDTRAAFDQFVGETFYGQMLASMRKTLGKPAYFHGGRAEEIFQGQLDQTLAEQMAKATAGSFSGPMFELFSLQRG